MSGIGNNLNGDPNIKFGYISQTGGIRSENNLVPQVRFVQNNTGVIRNSGQVNVVGGQGIQNVNFRPTTLSNTNQIYQVSQGGIELPPQHSIFRKHQGFQQSGVYNPPPVVVRQTITQQVVQPPIKQPAQVIVFQQPKRQPVQVRTDQYQSTPNCSPCSPCLVGCCICCPVTCQTCCKPNGSCGCCTKCCLPGQICDCCRVCCGPKGSCQCCQTCCLPGGICSCCTTCYAKGGCCECCATCGKIGGSCACCEDCCKPGCDSSTCCPDGCRQACRSCCCPWWVIALIILLCLAGLLIGLILGTNKGTQIYNDVKKAMTADAAPKGTQGTTTQPPQGNCQPGFFTYDGKCIQCPAGSTWNGTNCVKNQ